MGSVQVLPTFYDDLRDIPQSYLNALVDFIGVPRFGLTPSQVGCVHTSEFLTNPRNYYRTRRAHMIADWFKARRFDQIVVAIKDSPLRKLFLGGGPAFPQLSAEVSLRLYEIFRPEVEELGGIVNRDLSAWKSGGLQSSSTSPI